MGWTAPGNPLFHGYRLDPTVHGPDQLAGLVISQMLRQTGDTVTRRPRRSDEQYGQPGRQNYLEREDLLWLRRPRTTSGSRDCSRKLTTRLMPTDRCWPGAAGGQAGWRSGAGQACLVC